MSAINTHENEYKPGEIVLFCDGDNYHLIKCVGGEHEAVIFVKERTCTLEHVRSGDDYYVFRCSECGHEVGLHDIHPEKCHFNYCDNCGAKVVNHGN